MEIGSWFLVLGSWFLEFGIWNLEFGINLRYITEIAEMNHSNETGLRVSERGLRASLRVLSAEC
jgi:hypothetical protein